VDSLSDYLPLSLKSILFNRLAILAKEYELKELCILIVEKLPIPTTITDIQRSDLLCYCYAEFYKIIGDLENSKFFLKEAIRLNPELDGAHNNLGLILEEQGDLKGAFACYDKNDGNK
jgi:tetratricopeptide (TPR) repeat protein